MADTTLPPGLRPSYQVKNFSWSRHLFGLGHGFVAVKDMFENNYLRESTMIGSVYRIKIGYFSLPMNFEINTPSDNTFSPDVTEDEAMVVSRSRLL